MRLEQREVSRMLPDLARARVLDLGCGSGRYLALAAGTSLRIGLDPSPAMLARARPAGGLLVAGRLPRLPFADAAFDVAVCGLVIGHVPELGSAIGEIARVLRPGGVLVYSDVHPDGARRGWRRTFIAEDGRAYAIRHFVHAVPDHHRACAAAGLEVQGIAEPRVAAPGRWRGTRAVLVIRAGRPREGRTQ